MLMGWLLAFIRVLAAPVPAGTTADMIPRGSNTSPAVMGQYLGTVTTIPAPAPGATTAVAFNSRITDNLLRVGVNYKFDANDLWLDD